MCSGVISDFVSRKSLGCIEGRVLLPTLCSFICALVYLIRFVLAATTVTRFGHFLAALVSQSVVVRVRRAKCWVLTHFELFCWGLDERKSVT